MKIGTDGWPGACAAPARKAISKISAYVRMFIRPRLLTSVAGWLVRSHNHFGAILPTTESHIRCLPYLQGLFAAAWMVAVVMSEHRKRLWHGTNNDLTLESRRRHPLPES